MISAKAVGAGAFVVIGLLLFCSGAVHDRRARAMLFEKRFTRLHRVLAARRARRSARRFAWPARKPARSPTSSCRVTPSGKFRVKMEVREALHPIIRTDSIAVHADEGLVGGVFINIAAGTGSGCSASPTSGTIAPATRAVRRSATSCSRPTTR